MARRLKGSQSETQRGEGGAFFTLFHTSSHFKPLPPHHMSSSPQGVGKSCLAMRYVRGTFDAASRATVGAAFLSHTLTLPDGAKAKLEIWDTAGQER